MEWEHEDKGLCIHQGFQTAAPTALTGQADKSEVTPQAPPHAIRRLFYMGNFAFMGELSTEPEPRAS